MGRAGQGGDHSRRGGTVVSAQLEAGQVLGDLVLRLTRLFAEALAAGRYDDARRFATAAFRLRSGDRFVDFEAETVDR
jgi:hypothetical protein